MRSFEKKVALKEQFKIYRKRTYDVNKKSRKYEENTDA